MQFGKFFLPHFEKKQGKQNIDKDQRKKATIIALLLIQYSRLHSRPVHSVTFSVEFEENQ